MKLKKTILIIALVLALVGAGVSIYFARRSSHEITGEELESLRDQLKVYEDATETTEPDETESDTADPESSDETDEDETAEPATSETESDSEHDTDEDPTESPTSAPVVTPPMDQLLNFAEMQKLNPDIYAWIEIDGTLVDYPVLQSPYNDSKYLTTAYDGSWYVGGSLFTQATYNSKDFNDPVTIIYGHTMPSGTLFGQLQSEYSNPTTFDTHSEIKIYLPGEIRRYTVFAAVPYDHYHILHVYDFESEYWYNNFFKNVRKIRDFRANFNYDAFPETGDRVLILSTCLNEDSSVRYLVMAILQEDLNDQIK